MKVARLLEIHTDSFKSVTATYKADLLATNFGDAFLFQQNLIYRSIRRACLTNQYTFSSNINLPYLSLPFSQLEKILEARCIPFVDNVNVLKEISSTPVLKERLVWDDVSDGFKRNHVFHEGCHAVARTASLDCQIAASKTEKLRALQALLEESFANACELLALSYAEDSAHRCFYSANSYTTLFEYRGQLKKACEQFGETFMLRFLILTYLHANYLYDELTEAALTKVIDLAAEANQISLSTEKKKALRALSKTPFTLDIRFREVTTKFHFGLLGLRGDLRDLLSLDFLVKMQEPQYRNFLEQISDTALDRENPAKL